MIQSLACIDIIIADDEVMFREGLRKLLEAAPELRIVGEAGNGEQTVELVRQLKPQILLLDLSLPNASGLEALQELSKVGAPTRTIVLTADIKGQQAVKALQLGAHGIILKQSTTELLVQSIYCVNSGQYWVGQEGVSELVQALRRRDFGLTTREKQVIALIGEACTNKDLAQKLGISQNTVKHHLTNIFDKLGFSNRLEVALFAVEHRLVVED